MGKCRVKTTYRSEGDWGQSNIETLYCFHNMSNDTVTFYNTRGDVQEMLFHDWISGDGLYEAMERLYFPFKDAKWGGELKDRVENYSQQEFDNLKIAKNKSS